MARRHAMAEISGNRSIAQQRRPPLSPSKTVCPIITDNSTPLKLSESGKDSISQATSILSKLHSQRPQPTGIQSCPSSASTPRAKASSYFSFPAFEGQAVSSHEQPAEGAAQAQ